MTARAAAAAAPPARQVGLDRLRVFLIVLVICHHLACALGGTGLWYYVLPVPEGSLAPLVLTFFVAINQAFFMSLFFLVAGFFTVPSYARKGPGPFLRDRWIRLGIPLGVYFFLLNPSVEYLSQRFSGEIPAGYLAFLRRAWLAEVGFGPLWFVLSLLVFVHLYAAWQAARPARRAEPPSAPLPSPRQILAFVLAVGLVAFLVRIPFPVGQVFLGLQPGHFALYVCMYVFGLQAYRHGWLEQLDPASVRPWWRASLALIAALPVVLVLAGATGGDLGVDAFLGGANPQAWLYATWEAVLCVGISLKLLLVFRDRFARATPLGTRASQSAYTVYIIHPFFVVVGTWLLAAVPIDPLLKFAVLCPAVVLGTFAVADVLRRAPLVRRVV